MSVEDRLFEFIDSAKYYTLRVADVVDSKADSLAKQIRDAVANDSWIPTGVRSSPPPPPPSFLAPPNASLSTKFFNWAWDHRWAVTVVAAGISGTVTYNVLYIKHKSSKKRRARRASNNARKEVVVVAGSPHDPITKSVALDLERRGFIVFVVVNSMDDEQVVLGMGGRDMRPLNIDLFDADGSQTTNVIDKFSSYLASPVQAFPGAVSHRLNFTGMVVIPDSHYPTGPVETISASDWSDMLNVRLLWPFVTTKSFLPLLRGSQARVLVVTPTIVSSLHTPFHAPEAISVAATSAFTDSLRRELSPLGVGVTQLKLGTFDLSSVAGRQQMSNSNGPRADVIAWSSNVRGAYAHTYIGLNTGKSAKGTSLRELHLAVFDALTDKKVKRSVRVGSGSLIYELFGQLAPDSLVLWMLGSGRRRSEEKPLPGDVRGSASGSVSEGSVDWEKV